MIGKRFTEVMQNLIRSGNWIFGTYPEERYTEFISMKDVDHTTVLVIEHKDDIITSVRKERY